MKIIMGSPVKGFNLKNKVKEYLEKQGHEVIDVGCYQTDKFVKFSSIAERIAKALQDAVAPLAISCCGSGTGANICANKFKNVSAVCCESELSARLARVVNDANCLCLGESVLTPEMACRIADVFISSSFQDAKGTPQNILDFWKEARNEAMSGGIDAKSREIEILYSARMKIKLLASQIADWIFFDPTDGRYEYRPKEDRKNTDARCSPLCGCDLSSLDSHLSSASDTSVSKASPNANQSSKSSQPKVKFLPMWSIKSARIANDIVSLL